MKYIEANLETVSLRVPNGQQEKINATAAARGKSMAKYLVDLVGQDSGIEISLKDSLPE